ncbi:hypothetical protein NEOLEDRAFT_1178919 [Neolentinus lepideus HHB14362 ss-1]|uniref:Membrane-associated proteins in eicosanoid and glutathione metabolism n=1 Tax=Neolentinus lepideus HHB14362 ss-1 TaxID=1314782 RepID=A0A165S9A9_9AGAM|nr:hypothetical protein NEOLEDRAFT_1178919 [Neolentinus lepideus HHB14362 ss-1]
MPITLSTPLAIYSIPVVWLTTFYPMKMKVRLMDQTIGYNKVQPRANTQKIGKDAGTSPEVANRVARMEGAHLNGNEILPLWIGAVALGNHARLSNKAVNIASIAFITLRVLYNYVYINGTTTNQAHLRTLIWLSSVAVPMTLIIQSANTVRQLGLLPIF